MPFSGYTRHFIVALGALSTRWLLRRPLRRIPTNFVVPLNNFINPLDNFVNSLDISIVPLDNFVNPALQLLQPARRPRHPPPSRPVCLPGRQLRQAHDKFVNPARQLRRRGRQLRQPHRQHCHNFVVLVDGFLNPLDNIVSPARQHLQTARKLRFTDRKYKVVRGS
jgi:hypothetical protein